MSQHEVINRRYDLVDRLIYIGIAVNIVLAAGMLLAGWLGNSRAVFSDGVETSSDLFVALATLLGAKISRQPFDKDHPYGHGKAESIFSIGVGVFILAAGVGILFSAIRTGVNHHGLVRPAWFAVCMSGLTIVSKGMLARITLKVARNLKSPLLEALAADHKKDSMTSIATVIGAGGALAGILVLDPIAAGFSGLMVLRCGWECVRKAWDDLMDHALPDETLAPYVRLAESVEHVEHVHQIKGRRSGQLYILDLKLEMNPDMTVRESHEVSRKVKRLLFDFDEHIGEIMVHINPHDDGHHEDITRL